VADVLEPELDAVTDEILDTIAREVPDYARPLEGSFGEGVRTGVTEALRQFVELIRSPSGARGRGREVYVSLGRGELRQGRTLDALQSAYRVGARVAWRRMAEAARRAEIDPELLSLLAESIFAYIEELSADSVEGYAEARSQLEDERRRRRRELVAMLLRDPPADAADLRATAAAADWRIPRAAAAVACSQGELDELTRRLPPETLSAPVDGLGCIVIADPDGPGRRAQIERALRTGAQGPTTPLSGLAGSWSLARAARRATEAGVLGRAGLVRVDEALPALLLFENRELIERIAARRLAPFDELSPKARRRMEQTTLAYVQHQGNAAAMARALGLHAQTARYRLGRLRELLGDELHDPDARFELELSLRARLPDGASPP
jgi:PucR-like helix-turn-helix protein